MSILAASLRYWCALKVNDTPGWGQVCSLRLYLKKLADIL